MSSFAASQSEGVSKMHSKDIVPLNLCVKYDPPSIALHYTLAAKEGKKYLHVIRFDNLLTEGIDAATLYDRLVEKEKGYLSQKVVSKRQILKMLGEIISKKGGKASSSSDKAIKKASELKQNSPEEKKSTFLKTEEIVIEEKRKTNSKGEKETQDSKYQKDIAEDGDIGTSAGIIAQTHPSTEFNKVPIAKSEVADNSVEKELDVPFANFKEKKKTIPPFKSGNEDNSADYSDEFEPEQASMGNKIPEGKKENSVKPPVSNESNLKEKLVKDALLEDGNLEGEGFEYNEEEAAALDKLMNERKDMQKAYEQMLFEKNQDGEFEGREEEMEGDVDGEGIDELSPEEVEFLKRFQKVYVEELGEEVLMDPNGNLYDLNGNVIGQAASDDEEGSGEGSEDEIPPQNAGPPPRGKLGNGIPPRLPDLGNPKPKRSHSP